MSSGAAKTHPRGRKLLRVLIVVLIVAAAPAGYYLYQFVIRGNLHEVVPHEVYSSAQPSPEQLRAWVGEYGIRTVLNLRGDAGKVTHEEEAVAGKLGVKMISIPLSAHALPSVLVLNRLVETIDTAERPMLVHCQDGIDRSGFTDMLAVMAKGGKDFKEAKREMFLSRLRWGSGRHDLVAVVHRYERYSRRKGLNVNDWAEFRHWAKDVYKPAL
jgi:protein tyrosine/serine phosphatase